MEEPSNGIKISTTCSIESKFYTRLQQIPEMLSIKNYNYILDRKGLVYVTKN